MELGLHLGDSNDASRDLAEDVNGANLTTINGVITGPADITPSATSTPIGIIYDEDGSVTDALLGTGVSNSAYCAANSAFGGVDNFDVNAQFLHAVSFSTAIVRSLLRNYLTCNTIWLA